MRTVLRITAVCAACIAHGVAFAQDKPLFAAPHASNAATTSGDSIGQVTVALLIVLAVVFVAAWALKQARRLNLSGNPRSLQVVGQVALGAKERAVLIQVNGTQVLVGVAPGQVTALHTFTDLPPDAPALQPIDPTSGHPTSEQATSAPSFKSLLKQSLGMR